MTAPTADNSSQSAASSRSMQLSVLLPTQVVLTAEVTKLIAEAADGSFCLLPRHVDFVAALPPGLLALERVDGGEEFLAVDNGVLVKCGRTVTVSTLTVVQGVSLGQLRQAVAEQFRALDERQQSARTSLARLEATFVRRFVELGV